MESEKEFRNRIIFNCPKELHREIKFRALERNITMSTWIYRALLKAIQEERKAD